LGPSPGAALPTARALSGDARKSFAGGARDVLGCSAAVAGAAERDDRRTPTLQSVSPAAIATATPPITFLLRPDDELGGGRLGCLRIAASLRKSAGGGVEVRAKTPSAGVR